MISNDLACYNEHVILKASAVQIFIDLIQHLLFFLRCEGLGFCFIIVCLR